jgi:hypothetical protein
MATLKIERGQKAQVKVTKIDLCVKTVPFRTGTKCRHDIHIQNLDGDSAVCETFTPEGVRPDFVEGVMQWVQCVAVSSAPHFTMDIQPTDPPLTHSIVEYRPSQNTQSAARSEPPTENTMYTLNASGKMITFATAYAKDILVAEISKKPEGYEVTDDDIKKMMSWAAKICAETVDLINF